MLVLARFEGQKIVVGEGENEVVITVNELCDWKGRRRVKLGIEAPDAMPIIRPDALDKADRRKRETNGGMQQEVNQRRERS